ARHRRRPRLDPTGWCYGRPPAPRPRAPRRRTPNDRTHPDTPPRPAPAAAWKPKLASSRRRAPNLGIAGHRPAAMKLQSIDAVLGFHVDRSTIRLPKHAAHRGGDHTMTVGITEDHQPAPNQGIADEESSVDPTNPDR